MQKREQSSSGTVALDGFRSPLHVIYKRKSFLKRQNYCKGHLDKEDENNPVSWLYSKEVYWGITDLRLGLIVSRDTTSGIS